MKKSVVACILAILIVLGLLVAFFVLAGGFRAAINVSSIELYVDTSTVSEEETPLEIHISVQNSLPFDVSILGGNISAHFAGLRILSIKVPGNHTIRGFTTSTIILDARLNNSLVDDWWYRHLSMEECSQLALAGFLEIGSPAGSIILPVNYGSTIETSIFPLEIELNRVYDLSLLGEIAVKSIRIELVNVTRSETTLKATITIRNELVVPLYVNGVVFTVKLSDNTVIGCGEQYVPAYIGSGGEGLLVFNFKLENNKLPHWWYLHVKNRERSTIRINTWLKLRIVGRTVELFRDSPLEVNMEIETSIFKYEGQ